MQPGPLVPASGKRAGSTKRPPTCSASRPASSRPACRSTNSWCAIANRCPIPPVRTRSLLPSSTR